MQPRQPARATSFGPSDLRAIFSAFDAAWLEIAPKLGRDPRVVEAARTSLATIVLGIASSGVIGPNGLTAMAVAVFSAKHRLEGDHAN